MRRRDALAGLGGVAASGPLLAGALPARAQAPGRTVRLARLGPSGPNEALTRDVLLPELARLGFAEGRNLIFDARIGPPDALPGLLRELLQARPDIVFAIGDAASVAAAAAERTMPIVSFSTDPIGLGLARSYARPGGNVTGVVILGGELEAKRLSILHDAVPGRRRVAALVSTSQRRIVEPALRQAAADLDLELSVFPVAAPGEYPAAFAAMRAAGIEALVIGATPEFSRDVRQIAALALEARLPTVCEWMEMARDGCMIGYGPNRPALYRRVASQMALIFRGTPVGEVAIERPALFEFGVNRKIASLLGVTIPLAALAQADEVIE